MRVIRLKVNGTIPGFSPGQVVKVPADERGIPLDLHWRRRLKDSEIDGCVEVVMNLTPEKPANLTPEKPVNLTPEKPGKRKKKS